MSSKVLVADDSLTIQKVISITMQSNNFELTECLSEEELFNKLNSQKFDLVLLDFNLSEIKDGYQLAKEIKSLGQGTAILAMLGTFDEVDAGQIQEAGIGDTISKPFESSKFLEKCNSLIDAKSEQTFGFEEPSEEENSWEVESSPIDIPDETESIEFETSESIANNDLNNELNDWGINVPDIIGSSENIGPLPDIINNDIKFAEVDESFSESIDATPMDSEHQILGKTAIKSSEEDEQILPDDDDLAYPDPTSLFSSENNDEETKESSTEERRKPTLIPLSQLSPDESSDLNLIGEETQPFLELDKSKDLENEISKEINSDDLWNLSDSSEEVTNPEIKYDMESFSTEISSSESNLDEDKPSIEVSNFEENLPKSSVESISADFTDDFVDKVAEKISEKIAPKIEELIKKYCEESVEKVSWEVIPDLAENIIKKEIQEIKKSLN